MGRIKTESFSSISTFRQCPRKYYYRYLQKAEEVPVEALERGKRVHEAIQKRDCKKGGEEVKFALATMGRSARTPYKLADVQNLVHVQDKEPVVELVEERFALSATWEPTHWEDDTAIFRGVVDYARVRIDRAGLAERLRAGGGLLLEDLISGVDLVDWKTGKARSERKQLTWYSLFFFAEYPSLLETTCQNVYVTEAKKSPVWRVTRDRAPEIQAEIEGALEQIRREDTWRERPTPLCNYCPHKATCLEETGWGNSPQKELLRRSESLPW